MQHRNPRPFAHDLSRAKRILSARSESPDVALRVEGQVAHELIGDALCVRDLTARAGAHPSSAQLSPFAATELFASELMRWLTWLSEERELMAPTPSRYDLNFTTRTLFAELWRGRQAVEELGLPIPFYVETAVRYLAQKPLSRQPRTSQLFAPDVVSHVVRAWATSS